MVTPTSSRDTTRDRSLPQERLVPNKRVVQAWRAKTWPEGVYSIARFQLSSEGSGTKVVFDHDGFPADTKEHLSKGWQANYWDNLAKL